MNSRTIERYRGYARNGRVVAFDTETTGVSCHDEICQIAAVEYVSGIRARSMCVCICPTCEMNPFAEAVHGLSMDYLSLHGIDPVDALAKFFDFVGRDVLLVAHNNKFDLRMLRQECMKFEVEASSESIEMCDTLALSRFLRPGLASYRLCSLIEALGVEGVNSHDALDDSLACGGLFFKLLDS